MTVAGAPVGRRKERSRSKTGVEATIPAMDIASLQSAVNDASSRAAALWLSFLTFMAYLTMTVGAVTHENLLRQKPIQLPVLNVELPLVGFFWIAPLFFLLVHFYLFLQLTILVRKLASFDARLKDAVTTREQKEEYRRRLDSFLIVQFLSGAEEERYGLTGKLLRGVTVITLVILPILLLLQFQLTFLPYHDSWVTWIHRLAILVDLRLCWVFWSAIRGGTGNIDFPELRLRWRNAAKRGSFLRLIKQGILEIRRWIGGAFRSSPRSFVCSLAVLACSFLIFAASDERIAKALQVPIPHIDNNKIVWELKPIADAVLHGSIDMVGGRPRTWFSNVLVVPNRKLVEDTRIDMDFPSLSLRGRDLSGAVLIGSDLRNVDFTGANLNNAVLDRAQLARARFGCASLYDKVTQPGWPADGCTWLQRASFSQAEMQATDFKRARMHGAILIKANLQGADLSAAQLQGAMLSYADLVGASLRAADLSSAFLDGAYLIDADFSNSQLQGVLLGNTKLHFSSIQYVTSPSADRAPLRIAKPLPQEKSTSIDDQISAYFEYATVSPSSPEAAAENVKPGFDLESLTKFRQNAVASLIPYGIIERDFETTYEQATEKKWNEIVEALAKAKKPREGGKEYLTQLACNIGSGPFITPALIQSERILAAGPDTALAVIGILKNPGTSCPGARSLKPNLRAQLDDQEYRAKDMLRSAKSTN